MRKALSTVKSKRAVILASIVGDVKPAEDKLEQLEKELNAVFPIIEGRNKEAITNQVDKALGVIGE